jgi:hypothetical protein
VVRRDAKSRSDGTRAELVARFGNWHHPIPELVENTADEGVWCDHIYDLWPQRRWSAGAVTLILLRTLHAIARDD